MLPSTHRGAGRRSGGVGEDAVFPLLVAGVLTVALVALWSAGTFSSSADSVELQDFKARLQGERVAARAEQEPPQQRRKKRNFRLMTFNIANYDDHGEWPTRRKLIASLIERERPDVIALQELRHNMNHATETGHSPRGQLQHLLREINSAYGQPADVAGDICRHWLSKSHYYDRQADFW